MITSLFMLVIWAIVIGFVAWLLTILVDRLPFDPQIRQVLRVLILVVAIIAIIWLLLGLLGSSPRLGRL